MEQQIHGGNIYDKNIYNKEITLDYSVNINPLGMPQEVCNAITQDIGGYQTYPDIKYTALRNAIACKESINADNIYKVNINAKNILCGNGASELIMAVVRAVHPEKCAMHLHFQAMSVQLRRMEQGLYIMSLTVIMALAMNM